MLFNPSNGLSEIRRNFNASKFAASGQLISKSDLLSRLGTSEASLQTIEQILVPRAAMVCGKGVNTQYAEGTVRAMIQKDTNDFLAVMNGDEMLAYIVAEKGECKLKSEWWAVKLICGVPLPGSGTLLLGAMLYAARIEADRLQMDKKVILELANNYNNPGGFLAYSRLGFVKDLSLYYQEKKDVCEKDDEKRCFCEAGTMPMSCDIMKYTPEELIELMTGKRKLNPPDDTGLLETISNYSITRLPYKKDDPEYKLLEAEQGKCQNIGNQLLVYQKYERGLEQARAEKKRYTTMSEAKIKKGIEDNTKAALQCYADFQQLYQTLKSGAQPAFPIASTEVVPSVAAQPSFSSAAAPVRRERSTRQVARTTPYETRSRTSSRSKSGTKKKYSGKKKNRK